MRNQALLGALRSYRGQSWSTRLHVALRAATCPVAAIDDLLPPGGRILDLGCGHGLISLALAVSERDRHVVGVDRDRGKISAATSAAAASPAADRLSFHTVAPDWLPRPGSFDAVVIVDVLYLLDPVMRDSMLCASAAAANGTVVVKEMADGPRWKRALLRRQEQLSVDVARITAGDTVRLHSEAELCAPLLASGARLRMVDLARHRPHPHMAIVADTSDRRVRCTDTASARGWGG